MPLPVHRHAGRAVPALRHDARGGPLRGLRDVLLPARPDRRARAQGPPAVAPAEVAARRGGARAVATSRATRDSRRKDPMIEPARPLPTSSSPTRTATPSRLADLRGEHGRPLLLSQGRHARLHDPGLRRPRPPPGLRGGRRRRARRLARPGRSGQEVRRQAEALTFTLLADEDHAVAEAYGVWVEKSMYGRTYWGAQRATFVIDGDGVVRHVIPKVSPKTHDDEVLGVLAELAGGLSPATGRRVPPAPRCCGRGQDPGSQRGLVPLIGSWRAASRRGRLQPVRRDHARRPGAAAVGARRPRRRPRGPQRGLRAGVHRRRRRDARSRPLAG